MATLIQVLGEMIERTGISVEYGETEMLVKIVLRSGRHQVVKVRAVCDRYGKYTVLRFQSRVCLVQSSAMIRSALKANADSDWGAFALDTSVAPPALDVVYGFVTTPNSELVPGDLMTALHRVAAVADGTEQRTTGGDVF